MTRFTEKIQAQSQSMQAKAKEHDIWLINCLDANGQPCHFTIRSKDYLIKKMLKDSQKPGCNPADYGTILESHFGHVET
jgi:hypothetical protein